MFMTASTNNRIIHNFDSLLVDDHRRKDWRIFLKSIAMHFVLDTLISFMD